jgi:hypothetical protein
VIHWFNALSSERKGLVIYGVILAAWLFGFELPSKDVLGWAPWPSTTKTIRGAVQWWHPIGLMIPFGLFVLWGHFDLDWRATYLITTAVLFALAIVIHVLAP